MKNSTGRSNPPPARVYHPGRVLARELAARKIDIASLSRMTTIPPSDLESIVRCTASITRPISEALGLALGTSPDMWIDLQTSYDESD